MNSAIGLHELGAPDGDGPVVLLAHGMEDHWRSWLPLRDRLPANWRIAAADLPWRGGNDYRWRREACGGAWLRRAEDLLGAQADVLIGHSFGANAVLQRLTLPGGERARAAVAIAPFVREPELAVTWRTFERSQESFDQVIRESLTVRLGERAASVSGELRRSIARKMIDRIGPVGFLALFEQFVDSAELALEPVTVPTLITAGASDPALSGARAESLAARMPSATLRMREHYEHFCHVRQADDLALAVVEFVEDSLSGPAEPLARKDGTR
ncbi:alpha/beta hydrolase [Amycolatopsis sp. NPDC004079]|uniref:alpha/beta fold hydrolase n=1 Tax=Amycolatopsis sp. NPDC004079 TaxID=3154549 RepID=UPI0033BF7660